MSGLLDKANETVKASAEKEDSANKKDIETDVVWADGLESESGNGLDSTKLKFQLGAIVGFLVTMILVFFVDNLVLFAGITLDDLLVPGVLLCWAAFNGKELMVKEFDTMKLGASAVAFLIITGVFAGVAIFNATDSGVTIANIEFDGEDNEIDLDFYGPKGMDYTIEVLVDGKVEYSHDATISIDKGSHSVDLDDFWKGNAEDMNGDTLVEYEIKVISDGFEDSMTFDTIMNREVNTAYVSIVEILDSDEHVDAKTYTGISVKMLVGMGTPSCDPPEITSKCTEYDFQGISGFTGKAPMPVASDWSATVVVKLGSDIRHPYDEINVDEGIGENGAGQFNFDWVTLDNGADLERSDFYDIDGCYTFEVTIENVHGEVHVDTSSQIEFFWDANEADPDTSDDKEAEACN
ncbi:MAG: hypothetical protein HOM47_00910 [Euryarchaeota archaeon]|nr:hypothetical protein [Euryarchaeota archaeon]